MTRKKVLSNEQVNEIRRLYFAYVIGYGALAKKFNVGESTIRDVVKFYTYVSVN